ncbi:hypothetical protein SmJEL517_g01241 [Synchytrium microbalum]|uniref:Nucleolar GTP-binding protein 2 n=1 Tax=Synchytrium microbalum TaxID=1806994 RepID=A0A507CG81_9FUNG|nr:uncharacterized protein SmJEL517_g01241 [Synchytrium microbalum]TPX36483.1 hypothetical protein SmJEL517_g01241 [Synchytrium microbalum]
MAKKGYNGAGGSKAKKVDNIPTNIKVKGTNHYHDAATVKRLNILKGGKPIRNSTGKIVKAAPFQNHLNSGAVARVQPDRRWFENTRVVDQKSLEAFRDAMKTRANDPYTFLLKQNKLPMSLLQDSTKTSRVHLLEVDPFSSAFGPKAQRKRVKLSTETLADMAEKAATGADTYESVKDKNLLSNAAIDGVSEEARGPEFSKGQSKRIWNELYKVIDSSDVIIHVLDARDPMGTRCKNVETYMKNEAKHKHLLFVLNKCDLVPTWVTALWIKELSKDYPTLAFHASINNSFGKGSLIQLLRQFSRLHMDKKQISVGFVGYPNTGKSSIINTLRQKAVCTVAPIPGETKVWQYITLMKRIYLIDCPGVVYPAPEDTETDIVLKGVIRVEMLKNAEDHIPAVLARVRKEYMTKTYGISDWTDPIDFLTQWCKKSGRLLKGGEPDLGTASKMILMDWLRGKIPYYTLPPSYVDKKPESADKKGKKRKAAASDEVDAELVKEEGEAVGAAAVQLKELKRIVVAPAFNASDLKGPTSDDDVTEETEDVEDDEEDNEEEDEGDVVKEESLGEEASQDDGSTGEEDEEEEESDDE